LPLPRFALDIFRTKESTAASSVDAIANSKV
jgi:hypothetical protein